MLRKLKRHEGRAVGSGLESVATLPLGPGRSLALVRAGSDFVLVGVAEQMVTPIRRYSEDEARAAGLLVDDDDDALRVEGARVDTLTHDRARALTTSIGGDPPRVDSVQAGPARHAAPLDGALVNVNGSNAVEILVLVGGLTLVPAILFTVTGFTRIIIVLSFVRTAIGTQAEPPNQVLVGIALFLTLFVMAPTVSAIRKEAWDPLQHHQISVTTALKDAEEPMRQFMFKETRTTDIALFISLAHLKRPATEAQVPTYVLIPSFMVSELKTAFQIGFLIFLPFLIIDIVVSSTLDERRHDHAPADVHLAAVQDPAVRPRRRLGPAHPLARGELPLTAMDQNTVVNLASQAMTLAMKIGGPILLTGLVIGLVVSIFQAVTQIQEATLTFIPKIVGLGVLIVVLGPWMLGQLVSYTADLFNAIPTMVGG